MGKRFLSAAIVGLGMTLSAGAANAVTYDLQTTGSGGDDGVLTSGFGNTLTITQSGHTLVVSGFGEDGSDNFVTGELGRYSSGLGICNQNEGLDCSPNAHTQDNAGTDEWMLFIFDEVATIESVRLSAFGDTDVEWFVGTANITSGSIVGLDSGLAAINTLPGASGIVFGTSFGDSSSRTVDINGTGNFLLLGAYEEHSNDRFKVKNITATFNIVPEPATWALMIAGFAGLGVATRRRALAA